MLHDALDVISRMLEPGRTTHASYVGEYHSVHDAINLPKPIQPNGLPIMVGGNGPDVTWRLAARYADELNLDGMSPDEVRDALPTIRARCEEIGRDPASLAVSVHVGWSMPAWRVRGRARQALFAEYAKVGMSRLMGLLRDTTESDSALEDLVADARAAGVELAR
jgi:alkanesulfonate monooxygenase SsuD/methylene tetrahydromethanopterin reductase-like flavin-dependent oxidoreductase (luciferase family)